MVLFLAGKSFESERLFTWNFDSLDIPKKFWVASINAYFSPVVGSLAFVMSDEAKLCFRVLSLSCLLVFRLCFTSLAYYRWKRSFSCNSVFLPHQFYVPQSHKRSDFLATKKKYCSRRGLNKVVVKLQSFRKPVSVAYWFLNMHKKPAATDLGTQWSATDRQLVIDQ